MSKGKTTDSRPGIWQRVKGAWTVLRTGPATGASSWFALGLDLAGKKGGLAQPYKNSVWVSRAIKKIAGPISAMPVEVYRADVMTGLRARLREGRRERGEGRMPARRVIELGRASGVISQKEADAAVFNAPGLAGWLREPAPRMAWSDFLEAAVGWIKLAGELFWLQNEARPFNDVSNGWPKTIVARPDRVKEIVHGEDLLGWQWTDLAQKRWPLTDDQVVQSKCWNPYDPWRGLAEWEAARIASESDYLAGKFKRDLMANNGDTGPIVGLKGGASLDDGQIQQVREQLREKRRLQQSGIFAPIFLPGEITVEDPKVRTVDASYVAMRLSDQHEIALAFGVPPSMFDVKAAFSIGSASDYYQLIVDTCIPTGEKIADALERLFKKISGLDLEVHFNSDEHPVMRTVRRERIDSVDKLWTKGMPMSLVSDYLDLKLPPWTGWDQSYLPFSAAPAGSVGPDQAPALADQAPGESLPLKIARLALQAARRKKKEEGRGEGAEGRGERESVERGSVERGAWERGARSVECCGCSLEESDIVTCGRDSRELAEWKHLVAPRLAFIKRYRSKFDKVVFQARAEVIYKLEKLKAETLKAETLKAEMGQDQSLVTSSPTITRAAAADFMFDIEKFGTALIGEMRGVSAAAIQAAGEQVFHELKLDDPFKSPAKATMDFLGDRKNKLSNVPEEVFGRIKERISDGLERGDTIKELTNAVRAEFNEISDGRGKVIAQTETAAAYGFSRHEAMIEAGIRFKRWLTSGNANVRWAHVKMNGTIMPIDRTFVVVNEKGIKDEVMHPADGDGAPWNVINCHCIEVTSRTGPENPEAEPAT